MAQERIERKLAAVLVADVVGYSRLIDHDEARTLAALKDHQAHLIDPAIAGHQGRTVKWMGDGALVEFASVVAAMECAVAIQRGMANRNRDVPEDRRIEFRIGINLGDIIFDGDDIHGAGVNVAARLEGLAEPGGICIPRKVFHEVRNKLDVGYAFIGERSVKNIETPIPVYRVLLEPEAAGQVKGEERAGRSRWHLGAVAAAGLAVVVVALAAMWWQPWKPRGDPAADKPSIAVLPFDNMSGDPEQAYFADGMTDDLITRISKLSGLIVLSRTTSFTFKATELTSKEIARKAGVRYVLEGSVRRAEGAIRINAQLIDGTTGGHVWAETFDRPYKDIFALQDEVQRRIIAALEVKLTEKEKQEIARKPTDSVEAYEHYLRAEQLRLRLNWAEYREALALFDKALALDPNFVAAHLGNARAAFRVWRLSWLNVIWPPTARERMLSSLATVSKLDPDNAEALALQARVQLYLQNHDQALSLARDAARRHPENPWVQAVLANILLAMERPDEAREALRHALTLAPKPAPGLLSQVGFDHLLLGEAKRAEALLLRARKSGASGLVTALYLTAAYAQLDDMEKARAELEAVRGYWRWMSIAFLRVSHAHFRNQQRVSGNFFDPLLKAGVPEWPYGFKGRAENRLRNEDLKALFFGHPWVATGISSRGTPSASLSDGDGNYRWVEADNHTKTKSHGTLTVERDMVCFRIDAIQMGRKFCGEVYRNPDGSADESDEYSRVDFWGTHKFSIKPLEKM